VLARIRPEIEVAIGNPLAGERGRPVVHQSQRERLV
jgi:hypothetical protein